MVEIAGDVDITSLNLQESQMGHQRLLRCCRGLGPGLDLGLRWYG
jgi:hypothetical protein